MSAPPDLLRTIVAATRRTMELRQEREPQAALERRAAAARPRGPAFEQALGHRDAGATRPPHGRPNVIAECKRRSPSRGVLAAHYDPAALAREYERGGAAAISVLTEPTFFDGALEHLTAVRAAVGVPVLRKDFIVGDYQLFEARAAGADAILLIVAALEQAELVRLQARAWELGLAALVEVHDEDELTRAGDAGARLIGVNNRNLRTLAVDTSASDRLARLMPPGATAVSESGLKTRADLERLAAAGYRAFLIGERFMTDPDPAAAIKSLVGGDQGSGIGDHGRMSRGQGSGIGDRESKIDNPRLIPDPRSPIPGLKSTLVKICGITRVEDALHAAACGADAIGFVFWPNSPRYISPERAREVARALPDDIVTVGVFVDEPPDGLRRTAELVELDVVQINGDAPRAIFDGLATAVWKVITLATASEAIDQWRDELLLLDAHDPVRRGGTGRVVDWTQAAAIARRRRLVLAGGLSPANVAGAIEQVDPFGVDVSSGVESSPGIKDPAKVTEFLANARAAFARVRTLSPPAGGRQGEDTRGHD
jgi:indole-3-glycerol phosphate synthase/phosphoribosylanthranilate isomerase/anthranilate synthase/indole-3-glycerol phosphate synthase/phosphoribosylanthranilate isomerase